MNTKLAELRIDSGDSVAIFQHETHFSVKTNIGGIPASTPCKSFYSAWGVYGSISTNLINKMIERRKLKR